MANNYWDNSGFNPNLSRLPQEVRQSLSQPVPIRPDECRAAVMMFKQSPGMNHPNGRCNISVYKKEENAVIAMDAGLQLDFAEFSGRIPLSTVVIDKQYLETFLSGVLRAYISMGGDADAALNKARAARSFEERIQYFEETNNE